MTKTKALCLMGAYEGIRRLLFSYAIERSLLYFVTQLQSMGNL